MAYRPVPDSLARRPSICSPLESRLLFSAQLVGLGSGLVANFYSDASFANLAATELTPTVNYNWGSTTPTFDSGATAGSNQFSVRFTGKVQAQYNEPYTFHIATGGAATLYLNGQSLITTTGPAGDATGTITLTAGETYELRLDESETSSANLATLKWSSPSTPLDIVPVSQLYPDIGWVNPNWLDADVGAPIQTGSVSSVAGTYTVSSAGTGIGGGSDQFHYLYTTVNGDGTLVAHVDASTAIGQAGLQFRASSSPDAPFAGLVLSPNGTATFATRAAVNAVATTTTIAGLSSHYWLKLVRNGTFYTAYVSPDGVAWTFAASSVLSLPQTTLVGVGSSSMNPFAQGKATFTQIAVTPTIALGAGLDQVTDYSLGNAFVDMAKQARGFQNPRFNADAPVDSNGWPTTDFGVIFQSGFINAAHIYNGTYHLSFTGQATIGTWVSPASIQNLQYNAATNTTTADILLTASDAIEGWYFGLTFTNTIGGVQNIHLIRPGYPANTTQTFTNEYLAQLKDFSTLRFMDFAQTNNNTVVNWADRTKVTDAEQSGAKGAAWEYAIALSNQLHKDMWINIPINASNDYITQLATLLKNNLDPDRVVYVEYSNEIWNFGFHQFNDNLNAAQASVAAGNSPLNYDGSTNIYYWAYRRVGLQLKNISDLFAGVFGESAINSRIRPVLAGQIANPVTVSEPLAMLSSVFGDPSKYIYGIAGAPYFSVGAADSSTLDANGVFNALSSAVTQEQQLYPQYMATASQYGLQTLAYEGGPDTFGPNNIAAKAAASLDPRMQQLTQQYLSAWYAAGGSLFSWFIAGPTNYNTQFGTWGVSNALDNTSAPKLLGIEATLAAAKPAVTGGTPIPAAIDARQFVGESIPDYEPYLRFVHQGQSRSYLVRAPKAGSYALNFSEAAGDSNEQLQVSVNGTVQETVTLANTGDIYTWGDSPAGTVTLPGGMSVVTLTNVHEAGGWAMQSITLNAAPAHIVPPITSTPPVVIGQPVVVIPGTKSPVPTTPVASVPVASTPIASTPVPSTPVTSTPVTTMPVTSAPVVTTPVTSAPVISTPATRPPVPTAPLVIPPVMSTPVIRPPVTVSPLAYDGFSAVAHPLQGDVSGTGWNVDKAKGSVGWTVQNGDTRSYLASASGLTYESLATTGGSIAGAANYLSAGRRFDTGGATAAYVDPSTGRIGKPGTTLWLSVLVKRNAGRGGGATVLSLPSNSVPWYASNTALSFGVLNSRAAHLAWAIQVGGKTITTRKAVTVGQTALLVIRIDFGVKSSTASLFVNPVLSASNPTKMPPTTPDAVISAPAMQFTSLAYFAGTSVNASSIDELRLAGSYAGVTPTTIS